MTLLLPRTAVSEVIAETAVAFGVTVQQMMSDRQSRSIAWPRQAAMYLAAEHTCKSLPQIGRAFARDHTTVMYAIRQVRERIEAPAQYRAFLAALEDARERVGSRLLGGSLAERRLALFNAIVDVTRRRIEREARG